MSTRNILSPVWIAAVLAAVLGVGGLLYWKVFRSAPEPPPPPPMVGPAPTLPEPNLPPPPAIELPPLAASDDFVRGLVSGLSARPELAKILVTDHLVQRFVKVVDNVAHGESPRPHLVEVPEVGPASGFEVEEEADETVIAPASFHRYDTLAALVVSLDNEGTARLIRDLMPLFEEAYGELGNPDTFEEALGKAIDRLLAVPLPRGEIAVERGIRSFHFVDPDLEALAPAEKNLVRMGPKNAREIQSKLLVLKTALALTRNGAEE